MATWVCAIDQERRETGVIGERCFQLGLAALLLAGCTSERAPGAADAGAAVAPEDGGSASGSVQVATPPEAVTVPEIVALPPIAEPPPELRCPPEMVRVARRFCVDRHEAVLLDKATGFEISAFYPPSRQQAASVERAWSRMRFEMGSEEARRIELPLLPGWQKLRDFEPRAVSRKGVVPQGYTSGAQAALACRNAGKRLCTLDEWRTACRGERDEPFPYGPTYAPGRCNVFRERHPAAVLHDDVTIGHSDPRLNLVEVEGAPLLRRTGQTASCKSAWEGDAIADMVGNVDEWVDDPEGTFVGGFYARATKDGCLARVTTHPFDYFDYSTGIRCCADPRAR
jgi:formylglycine-generating enzyme